MNSETLIAKGNSLYIYYILIGIFKSIIYLNRNTVIFNEVGRMTYKIKSKWLKNKVLKLKFDNPEHREYVNDLAFIEKGITEGITGFGGGYRCGVLRNKYPREYSAMLKELYPTSYRNHIITADKQKKLDEKLYKEGEKMDSDKRKAEKVLWDVGSKRL